MKNKISAAIVVKNSPKYLNKTIESIYDFVDEIVIFDVGINNNTKRALNQYEKIKIIKIKKEILYADLIRESAQKYLTNNWCLHLDPDEIFPKGIINKISGCMDDYDCFSFPRKNIIFGKWVKYSRFWPDYQSRLFKKGKVFWPKRIHPQLIIEGREYLLEAREENAILHYNYENLNQWFEKFLRYAQVEAEYYFKNKKQLTFAETIKKALSEFISRYFAAHGYKDGLIGLSLSILQMFYYFVVYFYYLELKKFKEEITENYSLLIKNFFQNGFFETNFWLEKENLEGNLKKLKNKLINKLIKFLSR
ncbi:MAG: glycosyltransferase family 2 protein [Microgenomates group bacterium]